ncbi:MAG: hypothetical protein IJ455_04240 [Agathobacter sp.]|nr:hypothetical protein [Agathobacter sp.]
MKKRLLYLILPIIALILEILPYGAVLIFARPSEDGSIGYFRETYSYFDLLPFGYANFGPFITAILTCIVLFLLVIYCLIGKRQLITVTKNIVCIATLSSCLPILMGVKFLSLVGILISLSLAIETWFLIKCGNNEEI